MFESSVNPEGIQTLIFGVVVAQQFESSVNPEGIQTVGAVGLLQTSFESSVNPEGIQTQPVRNRNVVCLRVV